MWFARVLVMPFSPGADSWPPQDQLLSYHILEGRTNHTNLYLYHFKGYTQLLRSMLFCFVSFPAGSIYAPVCRLCSLVLGCSCIRCATHSSTSGVISGPLRNNTSNKNNNSILLPQVWSCQGVTRSNIFVQAISHHIRTSILHRGLAEHCQSLQSYICLFE